MSNTNSRFSGLDPARMAMLEELGSARIDELPLDDERGEHRRVSRQQIINTPLGNTFAAAVQSGRINDGIDASSRSNESNFSSGQNPSFSGGGSNYNRARHGNTALNAPQRNTSGLQAVPNVRDENTTRHQASTHALQENERGLRALTSTTHGNLSGPRSNRQAPINAQSGNTTGLQASQNATRDNETGPRALASTTHGNLPGPQSGRRAPTNALIGNTTGTPAGRQAAHTNIRSGRPDSFPSSIDNIIDDVFDFGLDTRSMAERGRRTVTGAAAHTTRGQTSQNKRSVAVPATMTGASVTKVSSVTTGPGALDAPLGQASGQDRVTAEVMDPEVMDPSTSTFPYTMETHVVDPRNHAKTYPVMVTLSTEEGPAVGTFCLWVEYNELRISWNVRNWHNFNRNNCQLVLQFGGLNSPHTYTLMFPDQRCLKTFMDHVRQLQSRLSAFHKTFGPNDLLWEDERTSNPDIISIIDGMAALKTSPARAPPAGETPIDIGEGPGNTEAPLRMPRTAMSDLLTLDMSGGPSDESQAPERSSVPMIELVRGFAQDEITKIIWHERDQGKSNDEIMGIARALLESLADNYLKGTEEWDQFDEAQQQAILTSIVQEVVESQREDSSTESKSSQRQEYSASDMLEMRAHAIPPPDYLRQVPIPRLGQETHAGRSCGPAQAQRNTRNKTSTGRSEQPATANTTTTTTTTTTATTTTIDAETSNLPAASFAVQDTNSREIDKLPADTASVASVQENSSSHVLVDTSNVSQQELLVDVSSPVSSYSVAQNAHQGLRDSRWNDGSTVMGAERRFTGPEHYPYPVTGSNLLLLATLGGNDVQTSNVSLLASLEDGDQGGHGHEGVMNTQSFELNAMPQSFTPTPAPVAPSVETTTTQHDEPSAAAKAETETPPVPEPTSNTSTMQSGSGSAEQPQPVVAQSTRKKSGLAASRWAT